MLRTWAPSEVADDEIDELDTLMKEHGITAAWQLKHLDSDMIRAVCKDLMTESVRPAPYALACEICAAMRKEGAPVQKEQGTDDFQRSTVSALRAVARRARRGDGKQSSGSDSDEKSGPSTCAKPCDVTICLTSPWNIFRNPRCCRLF